MKMKRWLSILLSLALVLSMMPGIGMTAYAADEVYYLEAAQTSGKCSYTRKSTSDYTEITDTTINWENGKTYIVSNDVTVEERITVCTNIA